MNLSKGRRPEVIAVELDGKFALSQRFLVKKSGIHRAKADSRCWPLPWQVATRRCLKGLDPVWWVFVGERLDEHVRRSELRFHDFEFAEIESRDGLRMLALAGDFAVHRRDKTNRSGVKMKCAGVALELQVGHTDGFRAERRITEGAVDGIGIGARLPEPRRNGGEGQQRQRE